MSVISGRIAQTQHPIQYGSQHFCQYTWRRLSFALIYSLIETVDQVLGESVRNIT